MKKWLESKTNFESKYMVIIENKYNKSLLKPKINIDDPKKYQLNTPIEKKVYTVYFESESKKETKDSKEYIEDC
jgi:predicted DNA-binding antitoxin AbrB/MazE fold protein